MNREVILKQVTLERAMQVGMGYTPECDAIHSMNDWIAILTRHLGLAASDGAEDSGERFRKQMIRVAATAVAAVEDYDKKHGKPIDYTKDLGPGW